jgi:hypothetical protein
MSEEWWEEVKAIFARLEEVARRLNEVDQDGSRRALLNEMNRLEKS